MKKYVMLVIALAVSALLLLPIASVANAQLPEKSPKEPLEKIEFIHYKKDFAKIASAKKHLRVTSS